LVPGEPELHHLELVRPLTVELPPFGSRSPVVNVAPTWDGAMRSGPVDATGRIEVLPRAVVINGVRVPRRRWWTPAAGRGSIHEPPIGDLVAGAGSICPRLPEAAA